jgi:hypothetical protein
MNRPWRRSHLLSGTPNARGDHCVRQARMRGYVKCSDTAPPGSQAIHCIFVTFGALPARERRPRPGELLGWARIRVTAAGMLLARDDPFPSLPSPSRPKGDQQRRYDDVGRGLLALALLA